MKFVKDPLCNEGIMIFNLTIYLLPYFNDYWNWNEFFDKHNLEEEIIYHNTGNTFIVCKWLFHSFLSKSNSVEMILSLTIINDDILLFIEPRNELASNL